MLPIFLRCFLPLPMTQHPQRNMHRADVEAGPLDDALHASQLPKADRLAQGLEKNFEKGSYHRLYVNFHMSFIFAYHCKFDSVNCIPLLSDTRHIVMDHLISLGIPLLRTRAFESCPPICPASTTTSKDVNTSRLSPTSTQPRGLATRRPLWMKSE